MVLVVCETGNDAFFQDLVEAYRSKLVDNIKNEIMEIKKRYHVHTVLPTSEWENISKKHFNNSIFPACNYLFNITCKNSKCKEPKLTLLTSSQQKYLAKELSDCKSKIEVEPLERTHYQQILSGLLQNGLKFFKIDAQGTHDEFLEAYKERIKKFASREDANNCIYICAKRKSDYVKFIKDLELNVYKCTEFKKVI